MPIWALLFLRFGVSTTPMEMHRSNVNRHFIGHRTNPASANKRTDLSAFLKAAPTFPEGSTILGFNEPDQ